MQTKTNEKQNMFIIGDNKLSKMMVPKAIWLVKIFVEKKKLKKKINKTNKQTQFYFRLFNHLIEIDKKMKDLQLCIDFISSYTTSISIKNKILRAKYITYHLEYYYINIVAIYDRILHLVNFVYKLGLHDRFVTKDIITKNDNIDKEVIELLRKIDKSIQGIRVLQNKIKHKEGLKEREKNKWFKNAEFFDQVQINKADLAKGKKSKLSVYAKRNYTLYIREKKKELKKNNKVLLQILNTFYNSLMPQIIKRTARFK